MITKTLALTAIFGLGLQDMLAAAQHPDANEKTIEDMENPTSITRECIMTSKEYGPSGATVSSFASNMDDLVETLEDKVLFMRTTDLFVCASGDAIYGVRVALEHDKAKDPEHNMALSTFYDDDATVYPEGQERQREIKFYEHMVGNQSGTCQNLHLEKGQHIRQILFSWDEKALRTMEIKLGNGEITKFGTHPNYENYMTQKVLNFSRYQEIIGVYGSMGPNTQFGHTAEHFASLGFILNQCQDAKLNKESKLRRDGTTKTKGKWGDGSRNDGRRRGQDENEPFKLIAIVLVCVLVFILCSYAFMKRRGKCCKKSQQDDQVQFDEVANASTAKKQPVSQDSMYSSNAKQGSSIQLDDSNRL